MKLEIIQPILTPVVASVPSNNLDNEANKFVFDYINKNNISLDKIDLEALKTEFIKQFPQKTQTVEAINLDNLKKSVDTHLQEIKDEINNSIRTDKKSKNTSSYIKRIYTDLTKKYMVNEDGQESSKNILSKIEALTTFYNEQNKNLEKYTLIVKNLTNASIVLNTICGIASAASVATFIASFFTAGVTAGLATATAIVATTSGIVSGLLDIILDIYKNHLKNVQDTIKFLKNVENMPPSDVIKKIVKITLNINYEAFSTYTKNVIPKFAKFLKYADVISNFYSAIESFNSVYNDIKFLETLSQDNKEATNTLKNLADKITNMKKVKWTVLHETPLDNYYILGGTGGINQIFKNIETGEILRLDQMLKFSKFELYSMGLTKARHPKTGWYIRTLPNKTKADNLG
ncbi:hypothetical protein [Mycoplasmopsis felifaucium]|uniref:hypothetical protein n=1 Tax=Mycoplasmopsis felifaucium TaxID=35768 RepID=UPI0004871C45|nr:hypothetical protein [Mycoplasmopsis felifaucium]